MVEIAFYFKLMPVMNIEERYLEVNKRLWNEKTQHHVDSDFYDMASFMAGKTSLKDIELGLLGDIKGKDIIHLQCHFGQDSLSLARMGANVTGLDLSDKSIDKARELNDALQLNAKFVCSDVYDAPANIDARFDMVFTTYGVLGWLPDMQKWASVVSQLLKPGGKLLLVEMHPAVWMFDNKFSYIQYPYFNREAIVETLSGTYADRDAPIQLEEIGWNHHLSEVIQSLINAGMKITHFEELDYMPYDVFDNAVEVAKDKYQLKDMEGKLPLTYSLMAVKE